MTESAPGRAPDRAARRAGGEPGRARRADLGFQQLSELIGEPGIEILGPLPPEIQALTIFSAGAVQRVSSSARLHAPSSPIWLPLKPATQNDAMAWSRHDCVARQKSKGGRKRKGDLSHERQARRARRDRPRWRRTRMSRIASAQGFSAVLSEEFSISDLRSRRLGRSTALDAASGHLAQRDRAWSLGRRCKNRWGPSPTFSAREFISFSASSGVWSSL